MPTILVIDDDRAVRHLVTELLTSANPDYKVISAAQVEPALQLVDQYRPDVVLLDLELPEISGLEAYGKIRAFDPTLPVVYITAGGTSDTAIEAMKLGAFDYLLKPLDATTLRKTVAAAMELRQQIRVPLGLAGALSPEDQGDQIVGRSAAVQEVFKAIGRVARQNLTVLIRGESGTGKELVARAIYQHSDRSDGPFLAVNCAAIPENLLESELFGHEKGAFTGAERQRIGRFEQCDGGTIFLDEIGDMPLVLQGKVLRLLQQQEFQRVGGNATIRTDVRIIAATHRPLEDMVATGEFRQDLLYRLNGFTIPLPPLRERGDDIVLLVQHYVARIARGLNRKIDGVSPAVIDILKAYPWPGNVRELEGIVRQMILRATTPILGPDLIPPTVISPTAGSRQVPVNDLASIPTHLPPDPPRSVADLDSSTSVMPRGVTSPPAASSTGHQNEAFDLEQFVEQQLASRSNSLHADCLQHMERYVLTRVLQLTGGNQSEASRILGITRGSLRHKLRQLGITIESSVHSGL